jgi:Carboxypeptidase regulatory-like domain
MFIRNYLRYFAIGSILISAILFHTTTTFAATNCDNYPVAICNVPNIPTPFTVQDDNTMATAQVSEPRLVYPLDVTPLNTLWITWKPQITGLYAADTSRGTATVFSPVDTELAVYRQTGTTFAGLIKLGSNDSWLQFEPVIQDFSNCFPQVPLPTGESSNKSCVKFIAYQGLTYVFQIDSSGNTPTGLVYLHLALINPLTPTASNASISGRVTNDSGRGISRSIVTLTDANGNERTATTNPFGYYRFVDVESGQNYVLQVKRKGYRFQNNPRVLNVNEDLTGEDFIPISVSSFKQRE